MDKLEKKARRPLLPALTALSGLASFGQNKNEVWFRDGTNGKLDRCKPIRDVSLELYPFVWASISAYQYDREPRVHRGVDNPCNRIDPKAVLQQAWVMWEEIPALGDLSCQLGRDMTRAHLRVQVWESKQQDKIMVAFGGTHNAADFKADFRWAEEFFIHPNDQYSVLFCEFTAAFIAAYKKRQNARHGSQAPQIIATGHSLGGGLAQGFAYAIELAEDADVRVTDVIAFDPSPVTGGRELPGWRHIAKSVHIQRVYNRGEILAILRGVFNATMPPRPNSAQFTDIRFAADWRWEQPLSVLGTVRAHLLRPLACTMLEQAQIIV